MEEIYQVIPSISMNLYFEGVDRYISDLNVSWLQILRLTKTLNKNVRDYSLLKPKTKNPGKIYTIVHNLYTFETYILNTFIGLLAYNRKSKKKKINKIYLKKILLFF